MIENEIQRKLDAATRSLGEALDTCSIFVRRNGSSPKAAAVRRTRRKIGGMMDALRSFRGVQQIIDMSDPDMMSEDERIMLFRQRKEEEERIKREEQRKQA
jgi:hypothetical protein